MSFNSILQVTRKQQSTSSMERAHSSFIYTLERLFYKSSGHWCSVAGRSEKKQSVEHCDPNDSGQSPQPKWKQ